MSNAHEEVRILGTLGSTHGKGLVRIQDRLESSVGEVWSALTDPARLAGWYGDVEGELRQGGEYHARLFASGWEGTGRIEVCDPPKRLLVMTKTARASEEQAIEVTLASDDGTILLIWEERGMPVELVAAYGAGIQVHVEDLAGYLRGSERCDAEARFNQLFPAYQRLPEESSA